MGGETDIQSIGGRETIVYETILVDTCRYIHVKTHRLHNSKSEP